MLKHNFVKLTLAGPVTEEPKPVFSENKMIILGKIHVINILI